VHSTVVTGKSIAKSIYGKPHTKSYYLGCSTGGRQGFKAAQEFPDDFDGIIAGAPGIAQISLISSSDRYYNITGPVNSTRFITEKMWAAINEHQLKQCDKLDGAADGIIEDPAACEFDPSTLLCKSGTQNDTCLTSAQNESFDMTKLTVDDVEFAIKQNPADAQTWNGDLSAFNARKSKLIHWHGQADSISFTSNSDRYYEHVRSTMKMGPAQLDDFYRYFRISGGEHCYGGVGAHMVGQDAVEEAGDSPEENVLSAIVRWVEDGVAPDTLTGTKYVDDEKSRGVAFQKKHCRYPLSNVHKGVGDWKDPGSWELIEMDIVLK
ncbi:tannase and feruloyl esterase, partial [Aulographum hederae CBS 113979]